MFSVARTAEIVVGAATVSTVAAILVASAGVSATAISALAAEVRALYAMFVRQDCTRSFN